MAIYSVAYDLNTPGKDYGQLFTALSAFNRFHAQKSLWFVESQLSALQLRQNLERHIDSNDSLFVTQIFKGAWAAWNMVGAGNWLLSKQG